MAIEPKNISRKPDDRLPRTSRGEAVIDSPVGRTLPDRKKADGFMDPQEALAANDMLRTAIDAISCDPEELKHSVEKNQEQFSSRAKQRVDWRLAIWVAVLLFIILAMDLLFQTL